MWSPALTTAAESQICADREPFLVVETGGVGQFFPVEGPNGASFKHTIVSLNVSICKVLSVELTYYGRQLTCPIG